MNRSIYNAALSLTAAIALIWSVFASAQGLITRGDLVKRRDLQTFGALSLFVDTVGNDANACTSSGSGACSTIQGALNRVPKRIQHPVTITVGVGSFAGAYVSGFTIDQAEVAATGAYLDVTGTLVDSTLATGLATGTATAGTAGTATPTVFGTLTDATQTWTVNDLRGRFVVITGGTGSGQIRVIQSNTATGVTISGTWTAPTGTSTYAIQDSGSVINSGVVSPAAPGAAAGSITVGLYANSNTHSVSNSSSTAYLVFERFKFTTTAYGVLFHGSGGRAMSRYTQTATTSNGIVLAEGAEARIDTSFVGASVVALAVQASAGGRPASAVRLTNSVFRADFVGIAVGNLSDLMGSGNAIETTAATGIGLSTLGLIGSMQLNSSRWDCGGVAGTRAILVAADSTGGILTPNIAGISDDISNCVTGVEYSGIGGVVMGGTWTGTGNTTVVSLAKGAALQITPTSTITGTTELSIDGVAYTLAQMRAQNPKRITDLATGSTAFEGTP